MPAIEASCPFPRLSRADHCRQCCDAASLAPCIRAWLDQAAAEARPRTRSVSAKLPLPADVWPRAA